MRCWQLNRRRKSRTLTFDSFTLNSALKLAKDLLKAAGIDNFNQEAEILAAFAFSIQREELYMNPGRLLSSYESDIFENILKERLNNNPLQRITGEASFRGHRICVGDAVFIPRQETEGLVDLVLPRVSKGSRIIDVGCGSGCIAISILKESEAALAVGMDISNASILTSRLNSIINRVDNRFVGLHADLMRMSFDQVKAYLENVVDGLSVDGFDLAVCNPPYISHDLIEALQPEVRYFDPHIALDGGSDGLLFYRILAQGISGYLKDGSYVFLELGDGQADDVVKIFSSFPQFHDFRVEKDLSSRERYLYMMYG